MDQWENSHTRSKSRHEKTPIDESADSSEEELERRPRRGRRENGHGGESKGMKMKIPNFQGKFDSQAYLEWEKKIRMVFDCQSYSAEHKIKLASLEFTDYVIAW